MSVRIVLALSLGLLCGGAWAQDSREARRDALLQIMSATGDDASLTSRKTREFLSSLSSDDAMAAEFDVLRWARKNDVITRLQFARGALSLNQSYAPDDEFVIDYWRYVIMIAAKLERREIAIEEYEYLEGRKMAEIKAARREADRSYQAEANDIINRSRASAAQPQQAQQAQQDGVAPMLTAIGNALRKPSNTTTCTQVGAVQKCTTR